MKVGQSPTRGSPTRGVATVTISPRRLSPTSAHQQRTPERPNSTTPKKSSPLSFKHNVMTNTSDDHAIKSTQDRRISRSTPTKASSSMTNAVLNSPPNSIGRNPPSRPDDETSDSDEPKLPRTPSPDSILQWLGSSHSSQSVKSPVWRRTLTSEWSPYRLRSSKISLADTPSKKSVYLRSDSEIAVEHAEYNHNPVDERMVHIPEFALKVMHARLRHADLTAQFIGLEKEILEIILKHDKSFLLEEQRLLKDDTDLAKITKFAEAGLELLQGIQDENLLCDDDPQVYNEANNHFMKLQRGVEIYLLNRVGAQREIQAKWNEHSKLLQKKNFIRDELEQAAKTLRELGAKHHINDARASPSTKDDRKKEVRHGEVDNKLCIVEIKMAVDISYIPSSPVLAVRLLDRLKQKQIGYFPSSPVLAVPLLEQRKQQPKEMIKPTVSKNQSNRGGFNIFPDEEKDIIEARYIRVGNSKINASTNF